MALTLWKSKYKAQTQKVKPKINYEKIGFSQLNLQLGFSCNKP
jgi:hypothetical protein